MSSTTNFSSTHRQRAEDYFASAVLRLKNALPTATCARLGQVTFPDFEDAVTLDERAQKLEKTLEALIAAQTQVGEKHNLRRKAGDLVVRWFRASYPFANHFLMVAKEGANVRCLTFAHLICSDTNSQSIRPDMQWSSCFDQCMFPSFRTLLRFLKIAYEESTRAEEIEESIQFLSSTIHRIQLTASFPKAIPEAIPAPQFDGAQTAALNLSAAVIDFLVTAIQTFKKPLPGQ